MINMKRLIFVIIIGVLFSCNFCLAYGQDKSVATLFSNNKKIEEEADSAVLFMEANKYHKEEKYEKSDSYPGCSGGCIRLAGSGV